MGRSLLSRVKSFLIRVSRARVVAVYIPVFLVLISTILVFMNLRRSERERLTAEFETQTANVSNGIRARFDVYQETVESISSLCATGLELDRERFKAFVSRTISQFDGIQALGWNPLVRREDRAAFEQAARADGLTEFQLKQWTPEGTETWTASDSEWADEYVPVYLLEPLEDNRPALGIDVNSNPTRRAALELARDTGRAVATARITLAQGTAEQVGFLMFVPVYAVGAKVDTIINRRSNLKAFAVGVFCVDDIVGQVIANLELEGIRIHITDESAAGDQRLLFQSELREESVSTGMLRTGMSSQLSTMYEYDVGSRHWVIEFVATQAYFDARSRWNSWLILAGGICSSFLLGVVLHLVIGRASEIEELVRLRTDQLQESRDALEQSNIELQQFAYVASHDLQTPLRAVAGFAQLLREQLQQQLDDESDRYIETIIGGCQRMQTMINDLLTYSRVESRSVPFQNVDLTEVFNNAVTDLAASIEETSGSVTHGELPMVVGDPAQLSQLLMNLIANGLKYHSDEPPQVHVDAEKHDGEWTISVRDNGIGIDSKYHERIFEVFRRLHTQDEYPGTGIGLAVCRRIARRHRGDLWLKSAPGEGATFFFTLAGINSESLPTTADV